MVLTIDVSNDPCSVLQEVRTGLLSRLSFELDGDWACSGLCVEQGANADGGLQTP